MKKKDKVFLSILCVLALGVTWLVRNHVFFWDTVQLGSKHAHWYYESGFKQLLLPDEIDSGHPPAFGIYLAGVWKVFGKSIAISHLAMVPFIFGILYSLLKLGQYYGGERWGRWFPLLALADPVLLTQTVLISPDVVLICFFLLAWYAIVSGRKGWKAIAAIGMALISTRGMMVVVGLYLFDVLSNRDNNLKKFFIRAIPYIPSGLIALAFLAYHYHVKGWIGYHPDSPWAPSFEMATFPQFLRNTLVLGWRLLDFGRIFIWLISLGVLAALWQKGQFNIRKITTFKALWLLLIITFSLSLTFLLYQGLQGHRYLLPIFVTFNLVFFVLIAKSTFAERTKKILLGLSMLGLATGNLWIYPDKVSQGWDSTLAHLPYYELRDDMLQYLEGNNIPLTEVGTAFPDIGALKYRDLSDRGDGMHAKNLQTSTYILYSNVMNDFTDEEIDSLKRFWKERHVLKNGGIRFVLYEKK
ncbi:MAG: hypothetical protein MI974_03745 [Chitinophagales bacterium]|nr:hypothetical protein [Chitinophagales bacterium]